MYNPNTPHQKNTEENMQHHNPASFAVPGNQYTAPQKPSVVKKLRNSLSTFFLFAFAILLAWVMITFVFQTYVVEGQSMRPTLNEADRLIVVKAGKTWSNITGDPYIPKRGSIIIFNRIGSENGEDRQLIKRVIGLPGERVVVRNGNLLVYNSEYPQGFSPDQTESFTLSTNVTSGNVDLTVPEGEVFVAGDNRSNSLDSRNFGTINDDNIIGELKLRILPLSESRTF